MPCLVLTGHPCAGKTTVAQLLRQACQDQPEKFGIDRVILINEASACPNQTKQQCYETSQAEKATRGALKAALDRALLSQHDDGESSSKTQRTLVLLDSLNYIKGFRYELHCLSKAAQEQHGVLWILNTVETERLWNEQRRQRDPDNNSSYTEELLDALMLRYEPPDARNRWDQPLFQIQMPPPTTTTGVINPAQQGEDLQQQQPTAGEALSSQALQQSVYNMHNLSSVLVSNTNNSPATKTTGSTANDDNTSPPEQQQPKKQPKVKFKRKKQTRNATETTTAAGTLTSPTTTTSERDAPLQADQLQQGGQSNQGTTTTTTTTTIPTLQQQVEDVLLQFLQSTKPLQQGMSTQAHVAHANADFLHQLDQITQQVCRAIHAADGDATKQATGDAPLDARLASCSASELQLWRQQYLTWCVTHPPADTSTKSQLAKAFGQYLQAQVDAKN